MIPIIGSKYSRVLIQLDILPIDVPQGVTIGLWNSYEFQTDVLQGVKMYLILVEYDQITERRWCDSENTIGIKRFIKMHLVHVG